MDLKKIIKGSSFMRDGITLVSGNVWAQVIAFASYLILSRRCRSQRCLCRNEAGDA